MNSRTNLLAAAALACAGVLVYLSARTQPDPGPQLIPVAEMPAPPVRPGEFAGRVAPVVLNDPAPEVPELRFADGAGREVALADFRGRAVVLNLWATWCVPCVEELPALDRLQAKLGGPGFEVVALSVDREGRSLVDPFLDKHAIRSLARYYDNGNLATRTLKARGLPTTLLIDAAGREIGRLEGAAAWDTPLAEAFLRRVLAVADGR